MEVFSKVGFSKEDFLVVDIKIMKVSFSFIMLYINGGVDLVSCIWF